MNKKERYQHYVINPITNEQQWYFPMELESVSYEKDSDEYLSYQEYLKNLKSQSVTLSNGTMVKCEYGRTKLGYREFDAIFIPVDSHESYLSLIKDEMDKQAEMKKDGRCILPAVKGGIKLCPCQIPNPDYVEGGNMPKTIMNKCEGCKYEKMKSAHTEVFFSALTSEDEDGEPCEFEPENPIGYNQADAYDELCENWVEFVKSRKPKLAELAELLSAEYIQTEAADILGKSVKTIHSQNQTLKDLVLEFLDTVI